MSKDNFDKAADSVKKVVDNTRDAVHEAEHRAAADGEKARREALKDSLTPGEKARSALDEAKQRAEAEIDATKRKIRNA